MLPTDKGIVRLASIYLPNGNPTPGDKYAYKLAFMNRLLKHSRDLLAFEEILVLAGDFNVIPEPRDAAHPEQWTSDALFLPETRAKSDDAGLYTFWDYQAGAWPKNDGIRIDHIMLSPQAADRLAGAGVDKSLRALEKASDHTPAWIELRVA